MKKLALFATLLSLNYFGFAQNSDDSSYLILKGVTILDMVSDEPRTGDVHIVDEIIEAIDYEQKMPVPEGATVHHLKGKYLLPGFIDGHVHITHGTYDEAREHLAIALKNGVTGVRDMGGDGRMLTLLQKNMKIGEDPGPDVFFGTIIAGPEFFEKDPRPQQVAKGAKAGEVPWQRAITNETDLQQIIAEAKGLGATAIKVYLSVDKDLFKKVADEAKRQGLLVWSHAAVPPTRPGDILLGGSQVISHAGDMIEYELVDEVVGRHDFETREAANEYREELRSIKWTPNTPKVKKLMDVMEEHNSILDATLFVYYYTLSDPSILEMYKKRGQPIDSSRYKSAMKTTRMVYEKGIPISAGSDHMISEDNAINIHKEIELLTIAGLSQLDALRAATRVNARVVGAENEMGTVEEGKVANLLILNSNPLEDITKTRDIKFVIKRGKVVQQ